MAKEHGGHGQTSADIIRLPYLIMLLIFFLNTTMITPLHTDFPNFTLPAEPRDIYFYERLAGVATQLFNARKSVSRAINIDNIFPRHIVDLASKEFPKPNFARQYAFETARTEMPDLFPIMVNDVAVNMSHRAP